MQIGTGGRLFVPQVRAHNDFPGRRSPKRAVRVSFLRPAFIVRSAAWAENFAMLARTVIVAALVLAMASTANAFRCGNRIVTEGDSRIDVLARCGRPSDVVTSSLQRRRHDFYRGYRTYIADGYEDLPVEYWTYNLGPNRLMQRLRFVDGIVVDIETLGYGYNEPGSN
jgi:hypothetical protein